MTVDIIIMLTLLVATFIVFGLELFPLEVTSTGLLAMLLLMGLIDTEQAISGLSNTAVVTIGAMLVLSHALTKTGLLEVAATKLSNAVGPRQWVGIAIMLITVAFASAFMSNTAVVAIFIPMAIHLSQRFKISPSKVLMPLSYAAVVGGTLTLIGTSTNLLVNAFIIESGQPSLGMFELGRMSWIFVLFGLAYIILFARKLLPSRAGLGSLTRKYHMGTYLTELRVKQDSTLIGKTCKAVGVNLNYDITVLAIIRESVRITENIRNIPLEADDILIVRGVVDNIMRLRKEQNVALLTDIKLSDSELSRDEQILAEGLITQTSRFNGRTLREIDFRRHYGAFVLAIRHNGTNIREKIAHIRLRVSDTLLILTPKDRIDDLRRADDLIIISEAKAELNRERYWWVVIMILPILIILVSLGVVDILRGALLSVALLLVIRAVDIKEIYRTMDWSVLLLIATFVPVGFAMVSTGTAQFIGERVLSLAHLFPAEWLPYTSLSLLYLITSILTQAVSNNATAIILAPVALSIATSLGVDARPFLVTIAFGASAAFMTPMAYQTNMMVYGPGSYRFIDYIRFGAAPNIGFWIIGSFLIPVFWPFTG